MDSIRERLRELSILIVDDEETIRVLLQELIGRYFGAVYLAADGIEGLRIYMDSRPDLILTDIRMPNMNGLEMLKMIRKADLEQKVIIASAFSDTEYLMEAIHQGISGYVLKPIKRTALFGAVRDAVDVLWSRRILEQSNLWLEQRVAEETAKNRQKDLERIENLQAVIRAFPSPTVVVEDGGHILYANHSFAGLLGQDVLDLPGQRLDIDDRLLGHEGCLRSVDEAVPDSRVPQRIAMASRGGNKIYHLLLRSLVLGSRDCRMYSLNDITLPEYQKVRIASYSRMLEEFVHHRLRGRGEASDQGAVSVPPADSADAADVAQPKRADDVPAASQGLRPDTGTRAASLSAAAFVADIGDDLSYEILQLGDIEEDLLEHAQLFSESAASDLLENIGGELGRYAAIMALMVEFGDLSNAISSLGQLVRALPGREPDAELLRRMAIFIDSIVDDLVQWRRSIFIDQNAVDIHYLDQSLLSSCLQIELLLFSGTVGSEDSEDDLDIFF